MGGLGIARRVTTLAIDPKGAHGIGFRCRFGHIGLPHPVFNTPFLDAAPAMQHRVFAGGCGIDYGPGRRSGILRLKYQWLCNRIFPAVHQHLNRRIRRQFPTRTKGPYTVTGPCDTGQGAIRTGCVCCRQTARPSIVSSGRHMER
ncbi:MAG: hypothetical protein BWY09_02895 [Candidatus Hydrogenedentes bacterium ADurb.Bin179]|nr:MAG: hypothetical protein BWY09_02895 [Candidatus Hydrogenedentes bacterium ADurb.Bin179]